MALVDPLQMAAIGGDRADAFVIVGQGARDGELAAAALAFGRFLGAGALTGTSLPPIFLVAAFFFFFLGAGGGGGLRQARAPWACRTRRAASASACLLGFGSSAALRASSSALRFSAAACSVLSFSSSRARRSRLPRRAAGFAVGTRASARAAARRAFSSSESWRSTTPRAGAALARGAWAWPWRGARAFPPAFRRALAAAWRAARAGCASSRPPPPWCGHG